MGNHYVPKKIFFTKGKGFHRLKLISFEEALKDAGIEKFNLVPVSSIFPPHCIEVKKSEGLKELKTGQIVYIVLAKACSDEIKQEICASIGFAKPINTKTHGYLSEFHTNNEGKKYTAKMAENLAVEMLASSLGDSANSGEDSRYIDDDHHINNKSIKTKNITQCATIKSKNTWGTVIAAAVFIL
jgi:arginine decarboxylase